MSVYINPKGLTKEQWLTANMLECSRVPYTFEDIPADTLLVCLVDNGPFTAAGVAFDKAEYEVFCNPNDKRQRVYCVVPRAKLLEVCPELSHYLEKGDG